MEELKELKKFIDEYNDMVGSNLVFAERGKNQKLIDWFNCAAITISVIEAKLDSLLNSENTEDVSIAKEYDDLHVVAECNVERKKTDEINEAIVDEALQKRIDGVRMCVINSSQETIDKNKNNLCGCINLCIRNHHSGT